MRVVKNPQHYTCLEEGRRHLYESLANDFKREIEVDREGLVITYPDFWRRI